MKIFFSVGEPSGDLHGANLIRELQRSAPHVTCVGYGGPRMHAAGLELHFELTQLAVMWIWRVITNLATFWQLVCRADRYFRHQRPDAVVLIDYPGFNWWIARRAKVHRIPVFYYGVPQMWAWAPWRVRKMRRLVDHVLCKLPFEVDWYRERGCAAQYVGHPYFDEMAHQQLDRKFVAVVHAAGQPLVTLLPGSRTQEVNANLKSFLSTAQQIRRELPQVRFAVAAYNERQAEVARQQVATDYGELPISIHVGRTPELIAAATVCLACSGSVSLELLHHEKPTVIHYKISRTAFVIQRFFRRVRFITLVNLLASEQRYCRHGERYDAAVDRIPFPEYLTCSDESAVMAQHVVTWLRDPAAYHATVAQLQQLKPQFAVAGATRRAAEYIVEQVATRERVRRTHYRPQAA